MDWYGVKLILKFERSGIPTKKDPDFTDDDFFEESIRIVKAHDFDDAAEKAKALALASDETYQTIYGQTVTTVLYDVIEVFHIYDVGDGEEIFSSIFRVPHGQDAERFLDRRYASCGEKQMRALRNKDFNQNRL